MKAHLSLLSALLVVTASAQVSKPLPGKMDEFYFHAADVALLQMKPVQKEIGVTEAQRKRMNDFADVHRGRLKTLEEQYKKSKKDPREAAKDPKLVGFFYELKLNVMRALKPAQLKRLGEISLQRVGLAALTDEIVGKKVGMSMAQVEKMRKAFRDGGQKYAAAEKAAAEPVLAKYKDKRVKDQKEAEAMQKAFNSDLGAAMKKAGPKLVGIKSAAEKSMKALLTPQQLAKYQALLGKKFNPA
jgi:hypothetical protein